MHYWRKWKYGDADENHPKPKQVNQIVPKGTKCKVEGCERPYKAKGFCTMHLQRFDMNGDPNLTKVPRNTLKDIYDRVHKGEEVGSLTSDGYRTISLEGKSYYVQRLIVEYHNNIKLSANETVHHKNGIKDDNVHTNLEIWTGNHPGGVRKEDLKEWILNYIKWHPEDFKDEFK